MAWYVNVNGQVWGPADDAQVIDWIHTRGIFGAVICQVGAQAWTELAAYPPFAAALRQAAPPPPTAGMAAPPARAVAAAPPPAKPMHPALRLALWAAGLVIAAFVVPVLGLLAGVGLIAHSVYARRRKRKSFVSRVMRSDPTAGMSVASLVLGAVLALAGGFQFVGNQIEAAAARRGAKAVADQFAKRQSDLLAQLPQREAAWRAKLSEVTAAASATPFVDGELATVQTVLADIDGVATTLGTHAPADLGQVRTEANAARDTYQARTDFNNTFQDFGQQVLKAREEAKAKHWITADDAYAAAGKDLDTLGKATPGLVALLPPGFDVAAKRKELDGLHAQIAWPVAAERKRLEKEEAAHKDQEAKQAAYALVCGERPSLSPWDGALIGLESTLKETANDPDSIEVKHCTTPVLSGDNCWVSTCDVRGKNAFGAKILKQMTFSKSALGFQEINQ